jgi:anti-anti-sigma regulatory factor
VSVEGRVLIGVEQDVFIVRFEGRLTQKSLWIIGDAAGQCRGNGAVRDLLVDVSGCEYMDSTMLGSLARWAIDFGRHRGARPFLVGLRGGALERIFERMSLTTLFRVASAASALGPRPGLSVAEAPERGRDERGEGVLLAHETLAELSPENAKEFAVLIEMLREELGGDTPQGRGAPRGGRDG